MFEKRIQKLKKFTTEHNLDYILIKGECDLLYYTGAHLSEGILLVGPSVSKLFVDGRYLEACLAKLSHLDEISLWGREKDELSKVFQGKKIGVDVGTLTAHEWLSLNEGLQNKLKPLDSGTCQIFRMDKDEVEIEKIQFASDVTTKGLAYIVSELREGIQEKELSQMLELYWLKEYGAKPAFDPIIAFGDHSACPHYTPDHTPLKSKDMVLIDLGAKLNDYCSDMTRTFFWKGGTEKQRDIYSSVLEAFNAAYEGFSPGKTGKDLDQLARASLESRGYGKVFSHSLGHGVGLDVHERPNLNTRQEDPLIESSVFTLEPGVYVSAVGGVRIEDTVLVRDGKLQILTSFSKDPNI